MLNVLLKIRLAALWNSIFARYGKRSKKRGPVMKILIFLLAVYVIGALFFSVGMLMYNIGKILIPIGLGFAYFGIASILCTALCFIGSVFTAQKQLYEANDNDLLLSMPIPPRNILLSRLLLLLISEYIYSILIMIPTGVVYCYFGNVTAGKVVIFILAVLLLPLLGLSLACLFGGIVAWAASKFRNIKLIYIVFTVVLMALYFIATANMEKYINYLMENGAQLANTIKQTLPPFYSFGAAISDGSFIELLFLALWCLIPAAAVYIILSLNFLKIATAKRGTVKIEYKENEMKERSAFAALISKELSRLFSLPIYILNCGLGAIMSLILSVMVIIKGEQIVALITEMPELADSPLIPAVIAAGLCLCASMTCTSCVSLSLEGKNIWLLKSLPVEPGEIYNAKIFVNIVIALPSFIISGILCCIALKPSLFMGLMLFVLPVASQVVFSYFGMAVNVLFPRFDWLNETVAIKQSVSTLIGIFGNMAIIALPLILYISVFSSIISVELYLAICIIIFALMSLLISLWLDSYGSKKLLYM